MKKIASVIALIAAIGAGVYLVAQMGPDDPEQGCGMFRMQRAGMGMDEGFSPMHMLLRIKDEIGLSAEQENKLNALRTAHGERAIKLDADMKIKGLKLRTLLAAEKVNLKEAEQLIREEAGLRADLHIGRLRLHQDIKALLTPEQRAKAEELKKNFRGSMRPQFHAGPREFGRDRERDPQN